MHLPSLFLGYTDDVMITADVLTSHFRYTDAAQLQRQTSDVVTELVLSCSVD